MKKKERKWGMAFNKGNKYRKLIAVKGCYLFSMDIISWQKQFYPLKLIKLFLGKRNDFGFVTEELENGSQRGTFHL